MQALVNRSRASLIDSPGNNAPPAACAGKVDSADEGDDGDEQALNVRKAVHARVIRNWLTLRLLRNRLRATPTYNTDLPTMTMRSSIRRCSIAVALNRLLFTSSIADRAINDSIPTDRPRLRPKIKS